ncbi:MAG: hypothetical protein JNM17_36570 [Archangium sp.]|nr:hypothetical protein [Archangium sp.]
MLRNVLIAFALSFTFGVLAGCGPEMTSSSSSQTCTQKYDCLNGSCKCTEGPKKDSSCCNPNDSQCTTDKCDTFCRYCQ